MAERYDQYTNLIPDPQTRSVVRALVALIVADLTDHKAKFDEFAAAVVADLEDIQATYDAHTHAADGEASFTSAPATDAAGNSTGTRSTITVTATETTFQAVGLEA